MGTKEKLIIVYSRVGWEKLTALIGSTSFSSRARKNVLDVINDNDCHQVDPGGAHLLYWSECNTSCPDMHLLLDHLTSSKIPSPEWIVQIIFDNGTEDSYGGLYNNSFSPSVKREFDWESHNAIKGNRLDISDPQAPAPSVAKTVNNHKCGACGNDRCSKHEKSCWKCGNPL